MRATVIQLCTPNDEDFHNAKGDRKQARKDRREGGSEFDKKVGTISKASTSLLGGIAGLASVFKKDKTTPTSTTIIQNPANNKDIQNFDNNKERITQKKYLIIGGSVLFISLIITVAVVVSRKKK